MFGAWSHKKKARYKMVKKTEDINKLKAKQQGIPRDLFKICKAWGFWFIACSIEPEENEEIVKWFLAKNSIFLMMI